MTPLDILIMAAGKGTRMKSRLPKVLQRLGGRPLLHHVLDQAAHLQARSATVITGHGAAEVEATTSHAATGGVALAFVRQEPQLGTGHAVQQAVPHLRDDGTVVVLSGDVPLTQADTLRALVATGGGERLALLTVTLPDPTGYGRIVRNGAGAVQGIVEHKDASEAQRAIAEVYSGIMAVPARLLAPWLARLTNDNAQGEYYLTDIVAMAVADGVPVVAHRITDALQVAGVNSPLQLAELERAHQQRQARALLEQGVRLADPARFDVRDEALRTTRADLDRIGLDVDPRSLVGDLSPAMKTGVAVARALRSTEEARPRVLVLDEPTATLPDDEVQRLMGIVRGAQKAGIGILYVTHRLDEVFELDGNVTVLRDGQRMIASSARELDKPQLINIMAGDELASELAESSRREVPGGSVVLTARNIHGASISRADIEVRRGEIVGIAGITGSGRETILPLLYGGRRTGEVTVDDKVVVANRPSASVAAGMGYLPPDRKIAGFADMSVSANTTVAGLKDFSSRLRIDRKTERSEAEEWTERMHVRPAHATNLLLSNLSGGNQQKVLFAKWLRLGLSVFLLDDPTQGVDVNAKALLHRQLVAAADEGLAAVVASTDVDELASLCDRVLVFRDGLIAAELVGNDVTVRSITHACLDSAPLDSNAKVSS